MMPLVIVCYYISIMHFSTMHQETAKQGEIPLAALFNSQKGKLCVGV